MATNEYLQSLQSVRDRCFRVQEAAVRHRLEHFEVDQSKLDDMIKLVVSLIKRDYDKPDDIPVHGCWRYFDAGGRPRIKNLINAWASLGEGAMEQTRRIIDLFVVAVLLDLEAGHVWSYREQLTGRTHKRNEGIAIAVLEMFNAGVFSSDPSKPHRVDCKLILIHFALIRYINFSYFSLQLRRYFISLTKHSREASKLTQLAPLSVLRTDLRFCVTSAKPFNHDQTILARPYHDPATSWVYRSHFV